MVMWGLSELQVQGKSPGSLVLVPFLIGGYGTASAQQGFWGVLWICFSGAECCTGMLLSLVMLLVPTLPTGLFPGLSLSLCVLDFVSGKLS